MPRFLIDVNVTNRLVQVYQDRIEAVESGSTPGDVGSSAICRVTAHVKPLFFFCRLCATRA